MKEKTQTSSEPSWLDPRNDRKTPFTDAELNVLADDFIARMTDTQAWQDLVADPEIDAVAICHHRGVAAQHDELAMSEVDHAHHAKDYR